MMNIQLRKYLNKTKYIQALLFLIIIISNILMVINSFLNISMTNAIINLDSHNFFKYLLIVIIMMVFVSLLNFLKGITESKSIEKISLLIREDYLRNYISNYNYEQSNLSDSAISNLTNDVNYVISHGLVSTYSLTNLVLGAIFPLIGAALIHWTFLIVFPLSLILMVFGMNYLSPILQKISKEKSILNEEFVSTISDFFSGFNTLYSYNALSNFKVKVSNASKTLEGKNKEFNNKNAGINSAMMGLMIVSQFFYIINAGLLVISGKISPGSIVGLMSIAQSFYSNSQMAFSMKVEIDSSKPIIEKLLANKDENIKYNNNISEIKKTIEVKNLNFIYPNTETQVIKNLTASYPMGNKYLISGKSGSGKSTFLKLISGRLRDYEGEIRYDDIDLKGISFEEISNTIAYIDQNPYIFEDTIKNNITLGKKINKDIYDQAILESGLLDFVNSKREKDKFILKKNGLNLSGGQKQRVAIARALVYDKKVFMIDEGLQGLDIETAKNIENTLVKMDGITLFMISHQDINEIHPGYSEIITM